MDIRQPKGGMVRVCGENNMTLEYSSILENVVIYMLTIYIFIVVHLPLLYGSLSLHGNKFKRRMGK